MAAQLVIVPLSPHQLLRRQTEVGCKKSFDGGGKDFQINFVTTYYFRPNTREQPEAVTSGPGAAGVRGWQITPR